MVRYSGMIMAYLDKFVIYSTTCKNNSNISSYYIAIPKMDGNEYSLCVGLPSSKIDFTLKDSILSEFNDNLKQIDSEKVIYAIPIIPSELIINEDNANDDKIYMELSQSLLSMMSDIFDEMIIDNHKQMEQRVFLVARNEIEKKFFDWMEMKYSKLFQEILIDNKLEQTLVNNSLTNNEISESGDSGNNLSGGPIGNSYGVNKSKVKVLVSSSKHGFSSIPALFLIIIMSLFLGIGLAIIMVK